MTNRLLAILTVFCLCIPAFGQFGQGQTQTRLLLSAQTARAGETVWAALEMKMPPKWHTYWRNGGDAGTPTKIRWVLPKGITAGAINWPTPEKAVTGSSDFTLITYEYEGEVVLTVPLKIAADMPSGPVTLQTSNEWQECSDFCVIGKSESAAVLMIGNGDKASSDAAEIEEWRKKVPSHEPSPAATVFWENSASQGADRAVVFDVKGASGSVDFYPYESAHFDVQGATEVLRGAADGVRFRKVIKKSDEKYSGNWPDHVDGLLVSKKDSNTVSAVDVSLPVLTSKPTTVAPAIAETGGWIILFLQLGAAFLGGLILNVMPCVLPVIGLKVLGFVSQSKEAPDRVKKLGLVYGVGVLFSFLVLALLAIAVQRAGGLANWGDAIRNPQFRVVMTVLMTLIALNLFGLFEVTLGSGTLGAANDLASKQGYPGAFFNGVVATLLATPCTAPFLGGALAFAFTQPPVITILVFLTAGSGLAFPFVVICFQPNLMKVLPKPGAWMEKFKIGMGFPMLATVVWLVWISIHGEDDVLRMGLFLVVMSFAAWIYGEFFQRGRKHRGMALVVCVVLLTLDYVVVLHQTKEEIEWKAWNVKDVEQARKEGHPVLVDFTAKSCFTCKLNLASSIDVAQTRAKLREIGAVTFKGDFTDQDPDIARELRSFNLTGVPLVLIYPKDLSKDPIVLPALLTKGIVLDALNQAGK